MTLRILLIGTTGQIGAELVGLLPQIGQVIALQRAQLDLSKPDQISRTIRELRPQLIVNAAAYTAVDQAEKDESTARAINADAPAVMAEEAKRIGAGIVHYSTDYVFDGRQTRPYTEDDKPNPSSVYGKTKLAGEQAIREVGVPHLIFRTAWVYATRGRNFLLTILRLASQREELRIVQDQVGSPTWCREVARGTLSILQALSQPSSDRLTLPSAGGTYHMTARGATTWYEFTTAILDEAAHAPSNLPWLASATNGRALLCTRVTPITTAEYLTPARRPAYSVLSNALMGRTFSVQLPDWRAQLHSAFLADPPDLPLVGS